MVLDRHLNTDALCYSTQIHMSLENGFFAKEFSLQKGTLCFRARSNLERHDTILTLTCLTSIPWQSLLVLDGEVRLSCNLPRREIRKPSLLFLQSIILWRRTWNWITSNQWPRAAAQRRLSLPFPASLLLGPSLCSLLIIWLSVCACLVP